MMRNKQEVTSLILKLNQALEEKMMHADPIEELMCIRVQINTLNWVLGADNETQAFIEAIDSVIVPSDSPISKESDGSYADAAVKQIIRLTELFEYEKAMAQQEAREAACN